jgi:hypothetical protein
LKSRNVARNNPTLPQASVSAKSWPAGIFGYYISPDGQTGEMSFGGYNTKKFADSNNASISWYLICFPSNLIID